jgi:hypothetical protein
MTEFQIVTADQRADFVEITDAIMPEAFPKFLNYDPAVVNHWKDLYRLFPDYQFALIDPSDGRTSTFGNCFPIFWDQPMAELPDGGFSWAITEAVRQCEAGVKPNNLCAFQIVVRQDLRNQGLSYKTVKQMVAVARRHRFAHLIAPVRPNRKSNFPLQDFSEYVRMKRPDGLPSDDWLRVHVRLGGEIVRPCVNSMEVSGTFDQWRKWCELDLTNPGPHVPAGGLVPLEVDRVTGTAKYVEPNVWVVHPVPE